MQSPLYVLDRHVRAVNNRRLEQALQHRRIRLARAGQPDGASKIIASLRNIAGVWLVSLGHRIQERPELGSGATQPELQPGNRNAG